MHTGLPRRSFLAAVATAAGARRLSAALTPTPGSVILFQGDSITDARRDRERSEANDARGLGGGYPALIAAALRRDHSKLDLKIYNRGISGNKVPDLDARWKTDCLDLKPSVLSILVGVNDIWHKLNGKYDGTVAQYQDGFAALLTRTRAALPAAHIVVCEPFVLRCGAVNDKWFPEFDERRAAARTVAQEAKATWVPFQSMFDKAVAFGTTPEYWAPDGVHPSIAGHALMAKTWREAVGV